MSQLLQAREAFLKDLTGTILTKDSQGVVAIADKHSKPSKRISEELLSRLPKGRVSDKVAGQKSGSLFEAACAGFLQEVVPLLAHIRPGNWQATKDTPSKAGLAGFVQYTHLGELQGLVKEHKGLAAMLGNDYLIKPDIVLWRNPLADTELDPNKTTAGRASAYCYRTPCSKQCPSAIAG